MRTGPVLLQIHPLDERAMEQARARQARLTKPPGSLGRLEELSIQLAGITGNPRPRCKSPAVLVLVADHGVARQGVSAFPQEVTMHMLKNFLQGGAAINALARSVGARVLVADFGVAGFPVHNKELHNWKVAAGTHDFSERPAMSAAEAMLAFDRGVQFANRELQRGGDLLAFGEMGIGNTTSAAAIACALLGRPAADLAGRGTGVDDERLARKIAVIDAALALHRPNPDDAYDVLAKVGGLEIGGMMGAMLAAGAARVPILVDGFIATAAALLACRVAPELRGRLIAAHRSAEGGHGLMLEALGLRPLLDLGLRLGEGTGAALAIPLVQAAARVLDEVVTFEEAGIFLRPSA
ncbi:MAG: nicotinate-nucleotide--dimethylbenzimidazole phosphoribosyltransferase [Verrucomicrobia bacterium]|nr:nicotinate-nucleotide--dimethylbenzimidazole phosphoribosyltransferase [Verrucomicrobiota bacterium]